MQETWCAHKLAEYTPSLLDSEESSLPWGYVCPYILCVMQSLIHGPKNTLNAESWRLKRLLFISSFSFLCEKAQDLSDCREMLILAPGLRVSSP